MLPVFALSSSIERWAFGCLLAKAFDVRRFFFLRLLIAALCLLLLGVRRSALGVRRFILPPTSSGNIRVSELVRFYSRFALDQRTDTTDETTRSHRSSNRPHRRHACNARCGIALLLSEKLSGEQRRAIGWTLVAVGALSTIPLALQLLGDDD